MENHPSQNRKRNNKQCFFTKVLTLTMLQSCFVQTVMLSVTKLHRSHWYQYYKTCFLRHLHGDNKHLSVCDSDPTLRYFKVLVHPCRLLPRSQILDCLQKLARSEHPSFIGCSCSLGVKDKSSSITRSHCFYIFFLRRRSCNKISSGICQEQTP
jgi:hypothetical protein